MRGFGFSQGDRKIMPRQGRVLMGDRKEFGPNSAVQLIDIEYETPDFFLVQGVSRFSVTWKISIGIDRAIMRTLEVGGDSFFYVVSARSISLTATATTADPRNVASGMVVPITFSTMAALQEFVDRAYTNQESFPPPIGLTPGIAIAPLSAADATILTSVPASVTSVLLGTSAKGLTVYNDSSTANLFLALGATASLTAFTARLVPGAYYEVPFGYQGPVSGIWDAAVGDARVTTVFDG